MDILHFFVEVLKWIGVGSPQRLIDGLVEDFSCFDDNLYLEVISPSGRDLDRCRI